MNLKRILSRIEQRLKATGLSADRASNLAGKKDAIRNMRRAVKGEVERSGVSNTTIEALAPILNTSAAWLLHEEGPEEVSKSTPTAGSVKEVPVISIVSAGRLQEPDVVEELNSAPTITAGNLKPGDWIGFRVEGHSMDRISPPASIILVNRKDKRLVANACYVIMGPDGEATYKRYRPDPMRFEPVSSDPLLDAIYPTDTPQIIGRVRRSIIDL